MNDKQLEDTDTTPATVDVEQIDNVLHRMMCLGMATGILTTYIKLAPTAAVEMDMSNDIFVEDAVRQVATSLRYAILDIAVFPTHTEVSLCPMAQLASLSLDAKDVRVLNVGQPVHTTVTPPAQPPTQVEPRRHP